MDQTKPQLSSVALLKRAERLNADEQKKDDPFHFGELLVYPNLGEPICKTQSRQLAFFRTVTPRKGTNMELTLGIETNSAAAPPA